MSEEPLRSSNAAAIAAALWDSADFAGAEVHFERALREAPNDLEALHGMGRLKLAQNELAAASVFLEQALALALHLPHSQREEQVQRIRRDLAWALYRLDRFDLAAGYFAHLPQQQALAAQLHAFHDRIPYRMASEIEEIVVPFLGTDPLPIIPVTVGSQDYPFVIDTGSSQLVVDTSIMRALELPNYGTREATFASGQRAPIAHTVVPSLMVGDVLIRDVPAEVMDVRRYAPQISGLVGTSMLSHFHVHCDWREEVLRLRPRGYEPFEAWKNTTQVPFWFFDSHLLFARARFNTNHETLAYVASGMAGGAFTVPSSTLRQAGLREEEGGMEGVGAGGSSDLRVVRADQVCLGEWCRSDMVGFGDFFPTELEWRYGFRVGALVSHEFIKRRQWGIDFERTCFYLA